MHAVPAAQRVCPLVPPPTDHLCNRSANSVVATRAAATVSIRASPQIAGFPRNSREFKLRRCLAPSVPLREAFRPTTTRRVAAKPEGDTNMANFMDLCTWLLLTLDTVIWGT